MDKEIYYIYEYVQTLTPVLHVDVWNEEKRFLGKVSLVDSDASLSQEIKYNVEKEEWVIIKLP